MYVSLASVEWTLLNFKLYSISSLVWYACEFEPKLCDLRVVDISIFYGQCMRYGRLHYFLLYARVGVRYPVCLRKLVNPPLGNWTWMGSCLHSPLH